MKIHYTILNIALITFLISCSNNQNHQKEKQAIKAALGNTLNQSTEAISEDTSKPATLKQLIESFSKEIDSLDKLRLYAYKKSNNKTQLPGDSIHIIENSYYSLYEKRNSEIFNYIIAHKKNAESLEGLLYIVLDKKISIVLIDSIFKDFPSTERTSRLGKLLANKIQERKKTELISSYNPAILDLLFEDQDGKLITLSQTNSTLILLDFWASWCAPCRHENRILVKEKERIIGNADVSVVAISLDTDKNKWLKASTEDNLSYLTICDFKAFESPLAKEFRIETIPFNVIIDKKGKILASNLWGDNLRNFLTSLKK